MTNGSESSLLYQTSQDLDIDTVSNPPPPRYNVLCGVLVRPYSR